MKSLKTLRDDIYELVLTNKGFDPDTVRAFGEGLAVKLANRLSEIRGKPRLRLSNIGKKCSRQLWYSINMPELALPLPAPTRIKFLFGDIIEELVIFLARAAGHTVTDEQKEVEIDGVKGHIDGKIDGVLVDVKSASTHSHRRFARGLTADDDGFGYLDQLGSYMAGLEVDEGAFIAVDKTLGHIVVDEHVSNKRDYQALVADRRAELASPTPPRRAFQDEPHQKSGNRKLGFGCSYCDFRETCWPGLRTFIDSGKPLYLTHVEREPRIKEVGKGETSSEEVRDQ